MKRFPIEFSSEALANLDDILVYIGRDSTARANSFGKKVFQKIERLSLFPESGRRVSNLADQLPQPREIIVGEYRVIYRVHTRKIEIMLLIHGKRLFPSKPIINQ